MGNRVCGCIFAEDTPELLFQSPVHVYFRQMLVLRFSSRHPCQQSLVMVKNCVPDAKKKGVAYMVPCKDCEYVYIGETKRTLQKQTKLLLNARMPITVLR